MRSEVAPILITNRNHKVSYRQLTPVQKIYINYSASPSLLY
jgi:hypothetical protein